MKHRVYQFIQALFGRMNTEGHLFIRYYLDSTEQQLFYEMHEADQFHAFRVALTAKELYIKHCRTDLDEYFLLIRCALLHDIGRTKGAVDIWGKVFSVLFFHFVPALSPYFMQKKDTCGLWGKLGTALYIYLNHPHIGGNKLRVIGDFREAEIVLRHQNKTAPEDSLVLFLLKIADARN